MKIEDVTVEDNTEESQKDQIVQYIPNSERDADIQKVLKPEVLDI